MLWKGTGITIRNKRSMIITIARQCGCGALDVGKILARYYGIPLYTRKSLMEAARGKGLLSEMEDFFEERPVDELMSAITFSFDRDDVQEKFCKAFRRVVGEGDYVLIGRCGNFIFRDRPDLLSVFLHGEPERRITHIMASEGLSRPEAEEFVRDTDDRRVAYHKFYTGLNWGNAPDYDICLDVCRLGAGKTAELIEEYADAAGLPHPSEKQCPAAREM